MADTKVSPAGKQVGHLDPVRRVRAAVDQGDGERDLVADVGGRVADGLEEQQVGFLGLDRGAVGVVGRDGVELVAVNGRRVHDRLVLSTVTAMVRVAVAAEATRADRPDAGDVVVGALAGAGRHEGHARGQQVGDGDTRGGVRPGVGDGEGVGDGVALLGFGSLTDLMISRSADCGVVGGAGGVVAVLGSNWSPSMVAVFRSGRARSPWR